PIATNVNKRTIGVLKLAIRIDSSESVKDIGVNVILSIDELFKPNQNVNHAKTIDAKRANIKT
ncbi:unnamed protein product, partial [Rotaria magnacalcarata]